ncbi:leucine-rich repeat protein [Clostridium weizhouense]|uniref:Leucine-rich repeat protein n=1 Tax=Clostridium weizhouense TaxID=2859781 RepID=A0ABS7ASF8_9CLOT|nr:leucine-rich repeat protein [Clostridium weizhouense]MBW6411605.1 leucine-rich repeat protein [Clostridium weizhouense]
MLKRKKYLVSLLIVALSMSFVDSSVVWARSNSTTDIVAEQKNGTGKTGVDENDIKWSYKECSDGTISIWQNDNLSGEVEIPKEIEGHTVSGIEENGLRESTEITSVKIPDSVKHIGDLAFFGCTSLRNIKIPSSITEIDVGAFENTSWLTNKRNSNPLVIVNGILIDGKDAVGDIVIPSNVTTIADSAFTVIDIGGSRRYRYGNYENITSVVIPEGVKKIGSGAFLGCYNLSKITIPSTVKEIGISAFGGCKPSNDTIYIPNSGVKIGDKAFNPNTKVILGASNNGNEISSDTSDFTSGWNYRGNDRYYVNSSGNLQTGWMDLDGKRYYFYGNGQMAIGFINLGNNSFYYLDPTVGNNMGNLVTGWYKVDGSWYYFNLNGKTGKEEGYMQIGWFYNNGSWYYFYGNGQMATGFINLGGDAYYYLDESSSSSIGIMKTGWQKNNGSWYYFNTSSSEGIVGMMKKGWQNIDGIWYYFYSEDGTMAHDTWINGWYLNSSGAWIK